MEILTQIITPDLAISLISLAFGIWVTWSKLNSRIEELEEFKKEANITDLNTKIAQIMTDIEWIKNTLSSKKK